MSTKNAKGQTKTAGVNNSPKATSDDKQADKKQNTSAEKTKTINKKIKALKIMLGLFFLFILAVSTFLWYIYYGPRWGSMYYGVCKIFAEQYIDFPSTMKVVDVLYPQTRGPSIELIVTHIDAAGQFNNDVLECSFGNQNLELTRVRIDRKVISNLNPDKPYREEILNNFNKGLDAILQNPPSLLLPRSMKYAPLSDLWRGEG